MSNQCRLKMKSFWGLGHRRTSCEKSLELVKKDVARFRLSVRGFCYLFGLLTRNNDASAMPRQTLLRTAAHMRRTAVATVVEQLMFVACLGSQQARPMVFGSVALDSFSVGGEEEKEKKNQKKSSLL